MKISTRKYVNNQNKWLHRHVTSELKAIRRAVDKVETTNTAKFEAQNEWRSQMKDQVSKYVTKGELWAIVLGAISLAAFIFQVLKTK